jgi:Putative Actinobacterial Holin-X, holin superfamily III
MVDQASMRGDGHVTATGRMGTAQPVTDTSVANGARDGNGPGQVVTNVAEVGQNVFTLAELQARLAVIELKRNLEAAKVGAAVLATGVVLALASLPIALAGIAELLVSELAMKRGLALLLVALVAFAIAGACITIAALRLRSSRPGFPLSQEEFARNVNWLRTVLLYRGRSRQW